MNICNKHFSRSTIFTLWYRNCNIPDNSFNTKATDALVPWFAMPSAAVIFTLQDKGLFSMGEDINELCCLLMPNNGGANILSYFLQWNQQRQILSSFPWAPFTILRLSNPQWYDHDKFYVWKLKPSNVDEQRCVNLLDIKTWTRPAILNIVSFIAPNRIPVQ